VAATVYDRHAAFYIDFVDRGLEVLGDVDPIAALAGCLGQRIKGARVLDLCCGEGYAGRRMLKLGAAEVVGIDLSSALIAEARRRADAPELSYRIDDAQALASVTDGEFDVVVSQLAIMDVADQRRLFVAVRRVLKAGGAFVFSMLHPCFEGRPFHVRTAPPYLLDEEGVPTAYLVQRYATEGWWDSGGDGVRGRMGAYHRMLSTYVNGLIAAGFVIERLEEPLAGDAYSGRGLFGEVPTVLVIAARAA
jgi:ubiquinone/menaquinone biosynthesis C-methylase UbiE